MATLLDDIGAYLEDKGIGTVGASTGWGIYLGWTPDTPHTCISILESPGLAPTEVMRSTRAAIEHPMVQVLVRGTDLDYASARGKATDAWFALNGVANTGALTSTTAVYYHRIEAVASPAPIGLDGQRRFLISCNYAISRQPSTA